jgi:hypothetical protein
MPELVAAWDGYSIEANYEGWKADCTKALEAVGNDLSASRYLNISVPDSVIDEEFREFKTIPVQKITRLDDPHSI